jgi:hypothetical protein
MPIDPEIQQLLAQMQDIITPNPVGWWPPSFSFATLLTGLIGLIVGISWAVYTSHKSNQYRREAQILYKQAMQQASTPQQQIEVANHLLKQVSITHYGRKTIANLTGQKWVDFLQKTANYIDQPEYLAEYFNAHYQADFKFDKQRLTSVLNYAQSWIKGHHK